MSAWTVDDTCEHLTLAWTVNGHMWTLALVTHVDITKNVGC